MSARPTAFIGARLLDPETGYDGDGGLLARDGLIAEVWRGADAPALSADVERIEAAGACLAPGLVDLRVKSGEPGAESKETLESAARAAAAGGVTTIVVQPDTDPPIDDPAVADFILRRARDVGLVRVYPAGAATKDLAGEAMAEIGLLAAAGCLYVTNADRPIADTRLMRRILSYAGGLGVLVAHRPEDVWLAHGAAATESEFSARLGLPGTPAVAESIMLERDLALADLTGARLLVDQISTAGAIESLARAKARGLPVIASASINHLSFNELDIGDYRTFCKLSPPLRGEGDRSALSRAVGEGLVDIVVSAHTPAPPEEKRLPYDEAASGAVGLETLLSALVSLHQQGEAPLLRLIEAVTLAPARAVGLPAGRLARGAPADLVLFDLDAPRVVDAAALVSRSKNSPFDGRRLQGEVLMTLVDGRRVFERAA
ncbi:MAG TPA: dihydroorotase [Caulobacteraceae bacterium]|nr:dihydroorotase [Caulobacteraceae bacterium]